MKALANRLARPQVTLLLFVLVAAIMAVMQSFFPATLAVPLPGSTIRPVLLLEFAATPQHLVHIFGEPGDPQRAARIAGMTTGNQLDYLLMPAYALLTLSFFLGVGRELGGTIWRLFGWMGVIAALADSVENAIMFRMVADMAHPLGEMAILPFPVWTKFGLLALTCGGAALAFARMRRWVLAALCLPAPLLLVPAMLDPYGIGPTATAMIGLGWLAMAIHAGSRWWQARRAS
ncbi:MAG: hypothetical protein IE933_12635 [Sphingomonadales bacterium]|nr:hypothetical protein [Sphingomonadales bacterium]MBD3773194.1 hypothetical protein [Paracoccaceae bacterium]